MYTGPPSAYLGKHGSLCRDKTHFSTLWFRRRRQRDDTPLSFGVHFGEIFIGPVFHNPSFKADLATQFVRHGSAANNLALWPWRLHQRFNADVTLFKLFSYLWTARACCLLISSEATSLDLLFKSCRVNSDWKTVFAEILHGKMLTLNFTFKVSEAGKH